MLLNRETDSHLTVRCTRRHTTHACRALPSQSHPTSQPTLWSPHRRQTALCTTYSHQRAPGSLASHRKVILRVLKTLHLKRLA